MAQVNFRIDDETKRRAEELFSSMGLTMSGAIMVFLRKSIDVRGIPFAVQKRDPSALPVAELLQRIDDVEHGRNCHEHTDEEVESLIAEAGNRQKAERRTMAKRSNCCDTGNRPLAHPPRILTREARI